MDVDPLASMRCWAIEIELGGRTFDVPALPAVDWWPVLVTADLHAVLDFIVSSPDDPNSLDEMLLSGGIDPEELTTALVDALEEATGRTMHSACVLASVATTHWTVVGGELAKLGFRWDIQPIGAALDAVFSVVISGIEKKEDRDKFLRLLDTDPMIKGRRGRNREKAVAEFETLAGPKPTAVLPATGAPSGNAHPRTPRLPRPPRQAAR